METLDEFRTKYNLVKAKGFIRSTRRGPTGIGKTFEDAMQKKEDNSPLPDFGPIEGKSQRKLSDAFITLFTLAPTEPEGANQMLLKKYGRPNLRHPERNNLHSSMFTHFNRTYNRWGFKIYPNDREGRLYLQVKNLETDSMEDTAIWYDYEIMKEKVETKLNILAFVMADEEKRNGWPYFKYTHCIMYYKCKFETFLDLIKDNKIMFDLRMGVYGPGKSFGKPHDHGSGFRIKRGSLKSAFWENHELI